MPQPPAKALILSAIDKEHLEKISKSTTERYGAVREAKGLLMAADGEANTEIANKLDVSRNTVLGWRRKFEKHGVKKVGKILPGRGRKASITQEAIDKVADETKKMVPANATHWSLRSMAKHIGLSRETIRRIWKGRGFKPHLVKTFKFSNDPRFDEKLQDVVGLYMDTPKNAVVLSFDEKSQIQALDRTQASLPMKKGRAETMTHDYKRNGTTTLFAALNVVTGELIGKCYDRHRHEEFLKFLKLIDKQIPKDQQIHIVLDNYATHKHKNVKKWLEKHKRFHLHFTPTSSSWLNLVERWFRHITDNMIRRGVFPSVKDLIAKINAFIAENNKNPKPYTWSKTADEILEKVRRGRVALQAAVI